MERHRNAQLAGDIVKVNEIPFLLTISSAPKFGAVQRMETQHMTAALKCLHDVWNLCAKRGFCIVLILMDGKFDSLHGELAGLGVILNAVSRGEHVPKAERRICTVKEST